MSAICCALTESSLHASNALYCAAATRVRMTYIASNVEIWLALTVPPRAVDPSVFAISVIAR